MHTAELESLSNRLARVERQNRCFRSLGLSIIAIGGMWLLLGQAPTTTQQATKYDTMPVIGRIAFLDSHLNARLSVGVDDNDSPHIKFFHPNGKTALAMVVGSDGAQSLLFNDPDGKLRAILRSQVNPDSVALFMGNDLRNAPEEGASMMVRGGMPNMALRKNKLGEIAIEFAAPPGASEASAAPRLKILSADETTAVMAMLLKGHPLIHIGDADATTTILPHGLSLKDQKSIIRANLSLEAGGTPLLQLGDSRGNVTWSVGGNR